MVEALSPSYQLRMTSNAKHLHLTTNVINLTCQVDDRWLGTNGPVHRMRGGFRLPMWLPSGMPTLVLHQIWPSAKWENACVWMQPYLSEISKPSIPVRFRRGSFLGPFAVSCPTHQSSKTRGTTRNSPNVVCRVSRILGAASKREKSRYTYLWLRSSQTKPKHTYTRSHRQTLAHNSVNAGLFLSLFAANESHL